MKKMVSIFKALSDRNRLRTIAALMSHQELCGCQLVELLGVSGATTSRHLGILISSGLVTSRKDGRWVYYRLQSDEEVINELGSVLGWIKSEFEKSNHILNDYTLLEEITAVEPEVLCRRQRGKECCP